MCSAAESRAKVDQERDQRAVAQADYGETSMLSSSFFASSPS
jgi:hypothetical protein